ncbi:MAG TPA: DinB family protein [Planctomycetaceae bacterium]|nr:DinB family protein [Planctomycetaceae bacterium]
MERAPSLLESIGRARDYTNHLLATIPTSDWFRMPQEGVSHVAWQVGHLAFAQYRLALERVRGKRPEDARLISPEFLQKFGRASTPIGDAAAYPSASEIRGVFDAVHRQVREEISAMDETIFDEPSEPHPRFSTKGGSLVWCAEHEMMHAGQIGLLRRLLGQPPLW